MRHTFHAEQWVPYPVELVFAFFANPENLPRLMPGWQKARIEEARIVPPPPRPQRLDPTRRFRSVAAGEGTELTISFRPIPLSPIRWPWEGVISEFVWNDHFCDEIRRGPFRYWRHCHRVAEEQREGGPEAGGSGSGNPGTRIGTRINDEVEYELPFTLLSGAANTVVVKRQLASLFAHRQRKLEQILARIAPGRPQ